MSNYSDFTIIIPALNEKENLKKFIPLLSNLYPGCDIFVADDGSSDGTGELLKKFIKNPATPGVKFLHRKTNRFFTSPQDGRGEISSRRFESKLPPGLTASVLEAIALTETEKLAVIDADFQHPPALPGKMYDKLQNSDIVCARRKNYSSMPFFRRLLSRAGNALASASLPARARKVKDPLSGAFAGRTEVLKKLLKKKNAVSPEGFKILFDILKLLPPSVRISRLDYNIQKRREGKSKIKLKHIRSFLKSLDAGTKKLLGGFVLITAFLFASLGAILIFGDYSISSFINETAATSGSLYRFLEIFTDYTLYFYYLIFASLMIAGLIKRKKTLTRLAVLYVCVQILGSVFITGGLKFTLGRPRPYAAEEAGRELNFFTFDGDFHSFPSRHSSDAFAGAGVIWAAASSWSLSIGFFIFSLLVAFSRVFLGVHYFSDILAGSFIGFTAALAVYFIFRLRRS